MSAPLLKRGDELFRCCETPGNLVVFLADVAFWASHRIHYDHQHARSEGYADVVVPGNLLHGWVERELVRWAGSPTALRQITFRHTGFVLVDQEVELSARVEEVDAHDVHPLVRCTIAVTRGGEDVMTGSATLRL